MDLSCIITLFRMQWDRFEEHNSRDSSPNKDKNAVDNIQQTKAALDSTIQELNAKLQQHFQNKQQALIEQYKVELIEAQKELNELKSKTNEEQIKAKMLERKKELERERHHLIQTNIFFSSKCEEYKKKLADLISEGKQLERELVFLDSQLNSTNKRKYQVLGNQDQQEFSMHSPPQLATAQKEPPGSLPLLSDRKPAESTRKLANSISVKSTNKRALIEQSLVARPKKTLIRGDLPKSVMQKTPLEQLFESTVKQIKERRKGKKAASNLKGEQFSDYEKKMIMEEFLSKEEVKKKIYDIIFDNEDKRQLTNPLDIEAKIKISYEDIS